MSHNALFLQLEDTVAGILSHNLQYDSANFFLSNANINALNLMF